MDNKELSREFNLMYNNIMSNKAPGLNEYEKSLVFTEAQEMLVVGLYNGSMSSSMSFEETEEVTAYLATLVAQAVTEEKQDPLLIKISEKSQVFKLPDDLMFITYEWCNIKDDSFCGEGHTRGAVVVPVTQDEYRRTMRNPFKGPNSNRVLRLSYSDADTDVRYSELVSRYNVDEYKVRYLRKPSPIVLADLPEGLSIDGVSESTPSSLPAFLHRKLILQAVSIAKSFWS